MNREKLRRFNWTRIAEPDINSSAFGSMQWNDLRIDKDALQELFSIRKAKALNLKDRPGKRVAPPLLAMVFFNIFF